MENPSPTVTPSAVVNTKTPVWKMSPASGSYYINSVAVSADGGRVVGGTFYHVYGATESRRKPPQPGALTASSASDNGTFGTYCYDAAGNLVWKNEFIGWQGVYWVAISSDGSRAASGGYMTQSPQAGFVRAFDATNGNVLLDQATALRVNQVALSADGTWLVSAAETLLLFKFDTGTGLYVQSDVYTPPTTSASQAAGSGSNAVVSVGLSADGNTIVLSDYSGHIIVLANQGGSLTQKQLWPLPSSFCHMVSLAPDGQAFAAGGASGCFYLFDTATFIQDGQPTYTYSTGISGPVYGVGVDAGGQVFAGVVNSGSEAGAVHVAEIVDDAVQTEADFPTSRNPNSVALNVAAGLMAVADGHPDGTPGNFYLYTGITGPGVPVSAAPSVPTLAWQYTTGDMSWPVVISANGQVVVGGSDDSYIYYFSV